MSKIKYPFKLEKDWISLSWKGFIYLAKRPLIGEVHDEVFTCIKDPKTQDVIPCQMTRYQRRRHIPVMIAIEDYAFANPKEEQLELDVQKAT